MLAFEDADLASRRLRLSGQERDGQAPGCGYWTRSGCLNAMPMACANVGDLFDAVVDGIDDQDADD